MSRPIRKSCGPSDIHESIVDQKPISIFTKHARVISIPDHSFNTLVGHFISNVLIHVLGLTMLQKFDSLEHRLRKRETVRLRGRNAEVGFGHGCLGDWIKQNSLDNCDFLLTFWWHGLVDFMIIIFG